MNAQERQALKHANNVIETELNRVCQIRLDRLKNWFARTFRAKRTMTIEFGVMGIDIVKIDGKHVDLDFDIPRWDVAGRWPQEEYHSNRRVPCLAKIKVALDDIDEITNQGRLFTPNSIVAKGGR